MTLLKLAMISNDIIMTKWGHDITFLFMDYDLKIF